MRLAPNRPLLVICLAVALFAVAVGQSSLSVQRVRIFTRGGVSFSSDVQKAAAKKPVSFGRKDSSPLAAWIAGRMAHALSLEPETAKTALYSGAWGLLVALVFASLCLYVAWPFALFGAGTLMLHPQWVQRLSETAPYASTAVDLLVPTLLALMALHSRRWLRFSLLALSGLWAGSAVFAHHLGLFCAVGLVASLALAGDRDVRRSPGIPLARHGFELLVLTMTMAVGFIAVYKMTGVKGKALIDFIFGPLAADHPPFALNGTVYLQGTSGEPPLWVAGWLWLVRTPPMLLLGGCMAALALKARTLGGNFAALWLVAANLLVVGLVATLSGSTLYFPGLDLMPVLAVYSVLLGSYGLAGFWRHLRGRLLDGRKVEVALLLVPPLLALGHQAVIVSQHSPYTAAYANVLGGSTGAFTARGNTLFAEPAIDSWAPEALPDGAHKIAVVPWGKGAQGVLRAASREAGIKKPVHAREGGPRPTIILYAPAWHYSRTAYSYCNEQQTLASLNAGSTPLWCIVQFQQRKIWSPNR